MADPRDELARLYDAHAAAAYGFLLRMVRDAGWAEDLEDAGQPVTIEVVRDGTTKTLPLLAR